MVCHALGHREPTRHITHVGIYRDSDEFKNLSGYLDEHSTVETDLATLGPQGEGQQVQNNRG